MGISIRNRFLHRFTAFIATEKRRFTTARRRLNNGSSPTINASGDGPVDMDVDIPHLDDIHDQSGNNILDENFFDEDNHLEEIRTGMRAGSKSRPRETERLQ